jgi:hypothetical protein
VDVAELVKRNVGHLATRSISVGTDEVAVNGSIRRMSTMEIALSKEAEPAIIANLPAPAQEHDDYSGENIVQASVAATTFVEQDPASVVDRLLLAKAAAPEKKKKAARASPAKKTRKKKTA